ncbi:hypothetical protein Mapa_003567 [Marchantia paleacea]|nr:hypothetical protein Mapa_003567 [Marchantia paleacea]
MASVCSAPDHLLAVCCCHRDSFAARSGSGVPLSVRLSDFHLRAGAGGWPSERRSQDFVGARRILTTGAGGAGVARHSSRLRIRCSETQSAVVSAQARESPKIVCEVCRGLGFFICDYCKGEKVNVPVKNRNNRFHRRCPTCRAVGVLMCSRCRVFKCVSFPDEDDGSLEKKR